MMIRSFSLDRLGYYIIGYFFLLLAACQPVYNEEEETSVESAGQSLKVMTRASGDSNIMYPTYIYAFNANGECVTRQNLTSPDSPIELKLEPASYTLVAISGVNEEYVLPEHPKMTDVIRMKAGNRSGRALMVGRSTVDVKRGKNVNNSVTITLYYVVSLVNVTIEGVPNNVKQMKLQISPLHAALAFNGEYGQAGQAAEIKCTPETDGVWGSVPFYVFPGSASQTVFSIILEDDKGIHTYGYTFNGSPQASVPFHIGGCFKGEVTLGGSLIPSDWKSPVEVRFDFGEAIEGTHSMPESAPHNPSEQPNVTELPAIGSIWKEGIVVAHLTKEGDQSSEILLMSLKEWYVLSSKLKEAIQSDVSAGWYLPNANEAHILHDTFSGTMFDAVNQAIKKQDANFPLLDADKRYLYDKDGTFFAFGFKKGSKHLIAGKTVKYKVRLLRKVPFSY